MSRGLALRKEVRNGVTQANDEHSCEIDVVLEDIGREGCNLVLVEVIARVAGCEAGSRSYS